MEPRSNGVVFICGESTLNDEDYIVPTKSILTANLATNWPVRTHYDPNGSDPRSNKDTLFRNISTSYVFLFIFSEETTMKAFYLNQLGIAFARGIPIVGIREPSYIMPNPLPEHYYSTEIVDLADVRSADTRNRPRSRSKSILSNLLIESFRNAVVYTTDFHKSCIERLFRKVTDAYSKSEREHGLAPNLTVKDSYGRRVIPAEPTIRQKLWTNVSGFTKCPKCGTSVKTNRKLSALRKTNSVDNLYKKDAPQPHSRQQVATPQLVITKSILQPVGGQQNFSKTIFNTGSRRPATSVVRKSCSARVVGREIERNYYKNISQSRPTSTKSCNAIASLTTRTRNQQYGGVKDENANKNGLAELMNVKENENTKTNPKENDKKVTRKTSNAGYVTNKRGAFLRKMSSLPCIPTTYLVADPASEAPAFVKYPPISGTLTVGEPNVPEFTDDEDKETIHISRRPSPAISTCSTNIE